MSRSRAAVVLMLAVLHVGAGIVSAIGACCEMESHTVAGEPLMECCLKGGPNHICPFMSKSRRSKAPAKINVYCPAGHDAGVPVTGFAAMAEATTVSRAAVAAPATPDTADRVILRVLYPPTPPPKQTLL